MYKQKKLAIAYYNSHQKEVEETKDPYLGINHRGIVNSGKTEAEVTFKMGKEEDTIGDCLILKKGEKAEMYKTIKVRRAAIQRTLGENEEIIRANILSKGKSRKVEDVDGVLDTGSVNTHIERKQLLKIKDKKKDGDITLTDFRGKKKNREKSTLQYSS